MLHYITIMLLVALFWCASALGDIIRVPEDQPDIQWGINAAVDGDTVLVADGLWYDNIRFRGKAITVASYFIINGDTSHINNTIIDGTLAYYPDSGSVVSFVSGEDTNSVISGFTIRNGTGTVFYPGLSRGGGGIVCLFSGAKITYNRIENNNVTYENTFGGGIYAGPIEDTSMVIIEHNTIFSNSIVANQNAGGGGISLRSNARISYNVVYDNDCFAQNSSSFGGGIRCASTAANRRLFVITDNTVINNSSTCATAYGWSGGIDMDGADAIILNNDISHNVVSGAPGLGAGISIGYASEGNTLLQDNTISFNTVLNGPCQGGGLFLLLIPNVTVQGNRFEGNASTWGGAIFDLETVNTSIIGNQMINNTATSLGGGIRVHNSSPVIENNLIAGNVSADGGGVSVFGSSNVPGNNPEVVHTKMLASIFAAKMAEKGAFSVPPQSPLNESTLTSEPQIINNTIVNNTAAGLGGGIYNFNSQTTVLNSILWGNEASFGPQIQPGGGSITVDYSDVEGGWSGTGNIGTNPEFADTLNFYLTSGSGCVDAGHPDSVYNDPESINNPGFACWPALGGLRNDMGAYGGPGVVCSIMVAINPDNPAEISPDRFTLFQNYPNPFNPSTHIEFRIADLGFVELKIYDVSGREVITLVSENLAPGEYKLHWDGKDASGNLLTSGVYFYRLIAGSFTQTRKMILMK